VKARPGRSAGGRDARRRAGRPPPQHRRDAIHLVIGSVVTFCVPPQRGRGVKGSARQALQISRG
jgi:hypothetical protein